MLSAVQPRAQHPVVSVNLASMTRYRLATLGDVAQILPLFEEIMREHGVAPPGRERLSNSVTKILSSPQRLLLVADEDGKLVGMCTLTFSDTAWSEAPMCELQDIVVTRSRRRRGIGRGLVRTAEELARRRGCSRFFLLAEYWNLGAHAFYRALGFGDKTCLYFERDLGRRLP